MSAVARRYYERGRSALESGDLESAQESLRAALELAPTFGNARVAYAVALAKAGDCPRAASVLRAGLGRTSSAISTAAMYATLGDVLTLGGDFFGAEEAFQTAAQTPGFEVRVASGLARVYARLGRYRDMAAQLRRAAQPR
ncbi:MAG TPA: tetratricopeptide repeat protein [Kofleriaceae bacterium]|jgi:Flp pilus assembly protein TadD|nr:tetratricopeptide repeat protein [Kofleriaceae bacterium]